MPPELEGFAPALAACERRLDAALADFPLQVLEPARQTLAAGGKRLRPLLVFCCAAAERDDPDVIAGAAAVELVHVATLVHDDLLDGAATRRGQPTIARSRGEDAAVATGDFLFARAFAELIATGSMPAVQSLAEASLDLALGELSQGSQAYDLTLAEADYLARCRRKTASLFAAACRIGARLADEPADVVERLGRFGEQVGLAFQIFDDILDLTGSPSETGKPRGTDLRDGTITLPVILALRQEPGLAAGLGAANGTGGDALVERLATHAGVGEARERALDHVAAAQRALSGGPLGGADRAALDAIAAGVVDRYA